MNELEFWENKVFEAKRNLLYWQNENSYYWDSYPRNLMTPKEIKNTEYRFKSSLKIGIGEAVKEFSKINPDQNKINDYKENLQSKINALTYADVYEPSCVIIAHKND